jgi:hypothetical protein
VLRLERARGGVEIARSDDDVVDLQGGGRWSHMGTVGNSSRSPVASFRGNALPEPDVARSLTRRLHFDSDPLLCGGATDTLQAGAVRSKRPRDVSGV